MAKLTDKQKKQIIAEYALCQSYSAVASKFGINKTSVMRIIKSNPVAQQKVTEKKKQNDLDMIQYLEENKNKAQGIISKILQNLDNPEILELASPKEQATVMAIMIDKFVIPHVSRINRVDEDNYNENKQTLRSEIIAAVKEAKND